MKWVHNYQLFLFDFDGLLVNTESIHYQAYLNVFQFIGIQLNWTYPEYCQMAHSKSLGVKKALENKYQSFFETTGWDEIYRKKKQEYIRLIKKQKVGLMPGVQDLLEYLHQANIKSCVVTNSTKEQVEPILRHQPLLTKIPYWITREDYNSPKPDPECYQLAIEKYGNKQDQVIGFEDTPRGWTALRNSPLKAVLISSTLYPELQTFIKINEATHFSSFEKINIL